MKAYIGEWQVTTDLSADKQIMQGESEMKSLPAKEKACSKALGWGFLCYWRGKGLGNHGDQVRKDVGVCSCLGMKNKDNC